MAAKMAYNPKNDASAKSLGQQMKKELDFSWYLNKAGISDIHLANTIKNAMEANKVISARIVGAEAGSMTDDFIDVPDHIVRLKATELALKYKHVPKGADEATGNTYVQIIQNQKNEYGI